MSWNGLPKHWDTVFTKYRVNRDNWITGDYRLCDQHSIKGVSMWPRQRTRSQAMLNSDSQLREPGFTQVRFQLRRDITSLWELAQAGLSGDFPSRSRAHPKAMIGVSDGVASGCR